MFTVMQRTVPTSSPDGNVRVFEDITGKSRLPVGIINSANNMKTSLLWVYVCVRMHMCICGCVYVCVSLKRKGWSSGMNGTLIFGVLA